MVLRQSFVEVIFSVLLYTRTSRVMCKNDKSYMVSHISPRHVSKFVSSINTLENHTLCIGENGIYRDMHYFLYFVSKRIIWYSLEPFHRGGSNEHRQPMIGAKHRKNKKKIIITCHLINAKFRSMKWLHYITYISWLDEYVFEFCKQSEDIR